MCRALSCDQCGKPTWAGCGAHVEQVIGHIPKAERCRCREKASAPASPAVTGETSLLARLFGK
ncbi:MAG: hypothetical protein RL199_427 [Pseudomonadota bacterium]